MIRLCSIFSRTRKASTLGHAQGCLRCLTIQARGKEAPTEHLFRYTNGRFLVNEEYELAKRYSPFDVGALCQLVSSIIKSPIVKIDKREGGYNKALLMTGENGHTVIAKIPCPNIVPHEYGTASEVAVLKFVKAHSRSPVSQVLAWNCSRFNPVRSEYIVLEKSSGQQLTKGWDNMSEPDRVKLICSFAQMESHLANIEFPGYGALYLRHELPACLRRHPERLIKVDDTYCLGPMYHGAWPGGFAAYPEEYISHSGPWETVSDLAQSLAQQGIWQVKNYKTSFAGRGPHYGTPEEHTQMLELAKEVMPILAESRVLKRHSQAVLTHPDLHPGNIFVSEDDPTDIQGVIDWQFTCVMPRFTQVRWPLFLDPPGDHQTETASAGLQGPGKSQLAQEQEQTQEKFQATRLKCYEAALVKTHLDTYLTLTETDASIRQLFVGCSYTYRDGVVPLRNSLIRAFQHWDTLGMDCPCPYSFTTAEIARHEVQLKEYRDWLKLRQHTHQMLHSNDGGWVPPEVDFDRVQARHDKLFRHFVESKKAKMSEEDARKLWFFRERG